jgi:hypothetical protein
MTALVFEARRPPQGFDLALRATDKRSGGVSVAGRPKPLHRRNSAAWESPQGTGACRRDIVLTKPFRIFCAVDGSPPGAAIFEQALAMNAHRGAQLVLVHAVSDDRPYSPWRNLPPREAGTSGTLPIECK